MSNNRNGYCEWANSSEEYISYHQAVPKLRDVSTSNLFLIASILDSEMNSE